jgi:hypothetical protein
VIFPSLSAGPVAGVAEGAAIEGIVVVPDIPADPEEGSAADAKRGNSRHEAQVTIQNEIAMGALIIGLSFEFRVFG